MPTYYPQMFLEPWGRGSIKSLQFEDSVEENIDKCHLLAQERL